MLIGSFSLSDLRGLAVDHMGVLGLPIAEYLALLHDTEYAGELVVLGTLRNTLDISIL